MTQTAFRGAQLLNFTGFHTGLCHLFDCEKPLHSYYPELSFRAQRRAKVGSRLIFHEHETEWKSSHVPSRTYVIFTAAIFLDIEKKSSPQGGKFPFFSIAAYTKSAPSWGGRRIFAVSRVFLLAEESQKFENLFDEFERWKNKKINVF